MSRLLVADTGPLVALGGIGRLELLRTLYDAVLVPNAVHLEVLAGGTRAVGLSDYKRMNWIDVVEVNNIDPSLLALLDEGEAAVIALARLHGANSVLIDEQKARKIARSIYGLHVLGSVRVLLDAKRQGLLEDVGAALLGMRDNGYHLHENIVRRALSEAGETALKGEQ